MKKNIFRAAALSAMLTLGLSSMQAQRSYECPPLNPEWQAMAEQIVTLNVDDTEKADQVLKQLYKQIK